MGWKVSAIKERSQPEGVVDVTPVNSVVQTVAPAPAGLDRRRYLLGLGAAVAALAGCADESVPARTVKPKNTVKVTKDGGGTVTASGGTAGDGGTVSANCTCMPPGTTAPPAAPAAGTTQPTTGTAGGVAVTTFKLLSAANAQISVLDDPMPMMGVAPPAPTATMADGSKILVWGLVDTVTSLGFNGTMVTPGPVLEMVEGQPVAVTLNAMMPHTMHWHGLDVPTPVDGDPDTSGWVGMMPAPRVDPAKGLGSSFTYSFTAPPAGTYFYHCHVDTVVHMEMGMMGSVVVRPPGGVSRVYANGPVFEKEYIWQLHTMDSTWHKPGHVVSGTTNFRYVPDYFLINGMDGANLLTDTSTAVTATVGQAVLIRLVNFGYLTAEVWLGGVTFLVASSDGRPLKANLRTDKLVVGAGERYDILLDASAAASVSPEVRYYNALGTKVLGKAITALVIA